MIMKIFIVVFCLGVAAFVLSLLPQLHLGNQMTTQLVVRNLSFYNTNAKLPTLVGLPAGSHILSSSNMSSGFSGIGEIAEIPKGIKLKVDVPDNTGSLKHHYSRLSVVQGRDKVLYRGKMIQGSVLLQEGDSIRIKTGQENSYIILAFNYGEG